MIVPCPGQKKNVALRFRRHRHWLRAGRTAWVCSARGSSVCCGGPTLCVRNIFEYTSLAILFCQGARTSMRTDHVAQSLAKCFVSPNSCRLIDSTARHRFPDSSQQQRCRSRQAPRRAHVKDFPLPRPTTCTDALACQCGCLQEAPHSGAVAASGSVGKALPTCAGA